MPLQVRADLVAAHTASLAHVVSGGATLDAARRRAVAEVVRASAVDPQPPPPWIRPYDDPVLDTAWRIARHANTITEAWYRQLIDDGMDPLTYVEILGVVVAVVSPVTFARGIGSLLPELPVEAPCAAGRIAEAIVDARLNWVPVAAPADQVASVVQALSALPDEWDNLWRLAETQYMSDRQMDDRLWNRGTLSRPQMEVVAACVSLVRECFF